MSAKKRRSPGLRLETLEDRCVPAVICGVVYNDADANGLYQSETGISAVTLQLKDEAGNLVATTTSGSDGKYEFTKRDNISNQPAVSSYDAIFASAPTDLNRTATISQFDPALGTLLSIELVAEGSITSNTKIENLGSQQANVKAEYHGSLSYQVQGLGQTLTSNIDKEYTGTAAAFDGNADLQGASLKDFGDIKMDGQFTSVTITDASQMAAFIGSGSMNIAQQAAANSCSCGPGNLLSMVKTTAQGKVRVVYKYTPSNEIGPGKYTVHETQPANYVDGRETKDNVTVISGSEKTDVIQVTINNRTDRSCDNHFGELLGASVAGQVYHDVDKGGTINAGDLPIGSVPVALSGQDVFGNAVTRTTTTSATGAYSFNFLLPGTYKITETQPPTYSQGTNSIGSLGGTVDGDNFNLVARNGDAGVRYDFGEIRDTLIPPPPVINRTPPGPPLLFGKFMFFGGIDGL